MAGLAPATLPSNGEIAYVGDSNAGNSVSVNTLQGVTAPDK